MLRQVTKAGMETDVDLLRRTFDALMYLAGVLDLDGRIVLGNKLPFEVCATTQAEWVGVPFADGPWWQHDAAVRGRVGDLVTAAAAGAAGRADVTYWTAGGVRRADLQVAPLLDDDARPTHVLISAVDTTERDAGRAALDVARRRLEVVAEAGLTGAWEWDLATGRVGFDAALRAMWGLDPLAPLGVDRLIDRVHPDDRPRIEALTARMRRGEVTDEYEFRILRGDGQVRWLAARHASIRDAGGAVRTLIGVNWDVTERRRESEEMRLALAARRLALEAADMGLWEIDVPAGRVTWDGRSAAAFGVEAGSTTRVEDAVAQVHPEDRPRFLEGMAAAYDPAGAGRYECEYRTLPTGGERWFRAVGQVFFEGEGESRRPVRFIGGLKDATADIGREADLQNARRAAEAANLAKGQFLANMSHEIRTPMTAILGYADVLAARLDDGDDLQAVETIRRNGRFLVDILNDILDLSKIDSGKLEVRRERFDPARVLADVRSLMEVRSREKGLSFDLAADGPLPASVEGDPQRLRQILVNLVGNAVKFTQAGGVRVVARVDADASTLAVDVTDTGVGIGADVLGRLFRPFAQGDASVIRQHGGSGLGLEISRRLARMLGGDVTVTSEPGVGSTFRVVVATGDLAGVEMLDADFAALSANARVPGGPAVRLDGRRVLVVDDRSEVRAVVRQLFEDAGATVLDARNGREAADRVAADAAIDAVVMDMQMPVMDGYAAARAMRARGVAVPIIALTAHAMAGDEQRCLQAGCDAYATKPVEGPSLLGTVAGLIAQRRAAGGRTRVLLVEDAPDARRALTLLLRRQGFEVRPAADGKAARAAIDGFAPEVVLLDLGLPDADGITLRPELAALAGDAIPHFVALTGRDTDADRAATAAAGFARHVLKPAEPEALAALIRDLTADRSGVAAEAAADRREARPPPFDRG